MAEMREMVSDSIKTSSNNSLLKKYDIPVNHLDFSYVETCTNAKELEKIVKILRSGEEGFYPDLLKASEKRLEEINPKNKLLRKINPILSTTDLPNKQKTEIESNLNEWLKNCKLANNELESRRTNNLNIPVSVRKCAQIQEKCKNNEKTRISSTDYASWDKYDPDAEMLKLDLEEETLQKSAKQLVEEKHPKLVNFKCCTETEAIFLSEREREKGNEYFKVGDYQQAIDYYTNSVQIKATTSNLNNRSIAYMQLKQYDLAIKDCETVIEMDVNNFKAYLRLSQSYYELKQYERALRFVEIAIKLDPNNVKAQQLAETIRNNCANCNLIRNRMKISE